MIIINCHNDSSIMLNSNSIYDLSNLVLSAHNYLSASIDIIITDDNSLRKMKKKYFNEDAFTDVIAFNIEENPFEGEIYISYDRVKDNAEIYKQEFDDEFKRVIIHGLLHLCGYEDSTINDKENMRKMEDKFLNKFNTSIIDDI
tara:strand:- start:24 stop:455 length:432 start_codon:yes stop_codon:yes gene_type:complete